MMFTDDEALALSVGLLAARGLGLAQAAPAVASARAKLERVMPANLKRRVRAVDETVTLDLSGAVTPQDNAALAALSLAAQAQQRVHMHYRTAQRNDTERDFDPYGLAYRGGRWYVVGVCHLRNGLRSFRLDRVMDVRPLEVSFNRPAQFDALGHLAFSIATLPRAFSVEVLLRTDLKAAQAEFFSAIGVFEAVEEGVVLRSQTDDLEWFARQLAGLSFAFQIRHPAELRQAMETWAGKLLQLAKG
jgi:predicted DNA-binding transcriptional regulator YafY